MYNSKYTFEVRVNGRSISEYTDNSGDTWVEGRKSSEYTLFFRNNTSGKVKVVFSVDGLNVISGDTIFDRGYIVDPYRTIEIPGWRRDSDKVAKFYFSDLGRSYSSRAGKGTTNVGVIGCKVYTEKYVPSYKWTYIDYDQPWKKYPDVWGTGNWQGYGNVTYGSGVRGLSGSSTLGEPMLASGAVMDSMSPTTAYAASTGIEQKTSGGSPRRASAAVKQSVGTGWGNDQSFRTQNVNFQANTWEDAVFVIYYDSKQGLIKRNIVEAPRPRRQNVKPTAFPTDGCPPPLR